MTECTCQQTIDQIKLVAREGIVKELQFQLAKCEDERDLLATRIDALLLDLAIARGEITIVEVKDE